MDFVLDQYLFPNMSIAVFAFEQLPCGEAFKAEGRDVHGFGRAVENEFDQANARDRGSLEACAAQSADEIKPVQARGTAGGAYFKGFGCSDSH